jgi:hypothetical protein
MFDDAPHGSWTNILTAEMVVESMLAQAPTIGLNVAASQHNDGGVAPCPSQTSDALERVCFSRHVVQDQINRFSTDQFQGIGAAWQPTASETGLTPELLKAVPDKPCTIGIFRDEQDRQRLSQTFIREAIE